MLRFNRPGLRSTLTPIFLAFVSLVIAVVLWVAVSEADNPGKEAVFSGGIEVHAVNVPAGQAVSNIRQPVVSLKVSASDSTLSKLTTADFRAEVDLSRVTTPTADLVVIARVVGGKNVQIVDVSPSVVTVTLESETSKLVPVVVTRVGVPPQGYSVPTVDAQPSQVRVTGATSLVTLVEHADADVNLTGVRVGNTRQYTLIPRDLRGADIRGVRIEPANADIRISVVQQEVTQVIAVVPQVQGSVADGYNLLSVSADPPAIAISGPLEVMQALSFITTEPVDAGGLQKDLQRPARLRLPAGVQSTRDSVNVSLRVRPAVGEISTAVVPTITGLSESLKATVQTPSVNVRMRGELPTLRSLAPGAVKAVLQLNGLDEGVHVVNVSLTLPEGTTLVSVDPPQVPVVLRK